MNWKRIVVALVAISLHTVVPAKEVAKIIIGSAPGAGMDSVTRAISDALGEQMDRTFIVENRPGASSNIAAEHVAKAAPDGKTVLITYNAHPAAKSLFPDLPFDTVKSFRAVGMIASTPYILVARPGLPGKNLKDMIELAKKDKRTVTFGSAGLGTPQHLMLERLKKQTGVDVSMVHYKSSSQAQSDVIGGHVDFTLSTVAFAAPQVKAGRLKALAVTSKDRMADFPDAPTIAESGYDGFITDGWYAMLLPANTPQSVVDAYNTALNKVLSQPSIKERFDGMGLTPRPGTAESLEKQIRIDEKLWAGVIRELGIKPQ